MWQLNEIIKKNIRSSISQKRLNRHNRKNGTYGNGDGKDASHKGGGIVKESPKKNRGRAGEGGRKKGVKHKYPKTRNQHG